MELPPVASDTSATAIEIESPKTIILQNAVHNVKFDLDHQEIQHLLDAVDEELQKSTDSATVSDSTLLAKQVAIDVHVFRSLLVSISPAKKRLARNLSSTYTDSEYSSYYSHEGTNSNSEVLHKEIHNLQGIANRMIATGYSRECIEVYTSVRKIGVDEWFKKLLRIEKMNSKNIQRLEWRVQEEKIQLWLHAAKFFVRGLFAGERTLTKQIFNGLGTNNNIAHDCFMNTVKDCAIQFFNFVEAISGSRRSPEKLFKILELYEVLSDLLPDMETIFGSESGEFIRNQAAEILCSLSEAARGILSEFEKAVLGDISKVWILGGSVHPLTKYVMNYIHDMVEHKQTLIQLIVSNPSSLDHICSSKLDFDFSEFEGKLAPLELHLLWIIVALKFNLEGKSKQYKDTSLARLFIKNNVDYIVQEIEGSSKLGMIEYGFHIKLISLAKVNYQKSTLKTILDCFRCGCLSNVRSFGCVRFYF